VLSCSNALLSGRHRRVLRTVSRSTSPRGLDQAGYKRPLTILTVHTISQVHTTTPDSTSSTPGMSSPAALYGSAPIYVGLATCTGRRQIRFSSCRPDPDRAGVRLRAGAAGFVLSSYCRKLRPHDCTSARRLPRPAEGPTRTRSTAARPISPLNPIPGAKSPSSPTLAVDAYLRAQDQHGARPRSSSSAPLPRRRIFGRAGSEPSRRPRLTTRRDGELSAALVGIEPQREEAPTSGCAYDRGWRSPAVENTPRRARSVRSQSAPSSSAVRNRPHDVRDPRADDLVAGG